MPKLWLWGEEKVKLGFIRRFASCEVKLDLCLSAIFILSVVIPLITRNPVICQKAAKFLCYLLMC